MISLRRYFHLLFLGSYFLASPFHAQEPVKASAPDVPRFVRFSGQLRGRQADSTQPVAITIALYPERLGDGALWSETQLVALDPAGRFTVLLGSATNGLPPGLFQTMEPRWIGFHTSDLPEPERTMLVSVPYALKAGDAESLGGRRPSDFLTAADLSLVREGLVQSAVAATTSPFVGEDGTIPKFEVEGFVPSTMVEVDGKVGIGVAEPLRGLHVKSGSGAIIVDAGLETTNPALFFAHGRFASSFRNYIAANREDERLDIIARGVRTATFRGGRVGVGVTNPAESLDVSGNVRLSGKILFADGSVLDRGGAVAVLQAGDGLVVNGSSTDKVVGLRPCAEGEILRMTSGSWSCRQQTQVVAGPGLLASDPGEKRELALDTSFTDSRYLRLSGGAVTGKVEIDSGEADGVWIKQAIAGTALRLDATAGTGTNVGLSAFASSPTNTVAEFVSASDAGTLLEGKQGKNRDEAETVFRVDAKGSVTAKAFLGDGSKLTQVRAADTERFGGLAPTEYLQRSQSGQEVKGDITLLGKLSGAAEVSAEHVTAPRAKFDGLEVLNLTATGAANVETLLTRRIDVGEQASGSPSSLSLAGVVQAQAGNDAVGMHVHPTLVASALGVHKIFAGAYFASPAIVATQPNIVDAATVFIAGQPGVPGASNFSLFVGSGFNRIRDTLAVGPITITDPGTVLHVGQGNGSAHLTLERTATDGTEGKMALGADNQGFLVMDPQANYAKRFFVGRDGNTSVGAPPGPRRFEVSFSNVSNGIAIRNEASANEPNDSRIEFYLKNDAGVVRPFSYLVTQSTAIASGREQGTIFWGNLDEGTPHTVLKFVGKDATFGRDVAVPGRVQADRYFGNGEGITGVIAADAQLLGGIKSDKFARLDRPNVFADTVEARDFIGGGSKLTGVVAADAQKLGGLAADAFAQLAKSATFADAVVAKSFSGDGSLLTGVKAVDSDKLAGLLPDAFAQLAKPATFADAVIAKSFAGDGSLLKSVKAVDSDKLAGLLPDAFAQLAKPAVFVDAVAAKSFTGDGSLVTGVKAVDAEKFAGLLPDAFAQLARPATFVDAVVAKSFAGDGALLTGVKAVDAAKFAGLFPDAFAQLAKPATFTDTVIAKAFAGDGSLLKSVKAADSDKFAGLLPDAFAQLAKPATFLDAVIAKSFAGEGTQLTGVVAADSKLFGGLPPDAYLRSTVDAVFQGSITAAKFFGDGSGLTAVKAADASSLGGYPAADFARLTTTTAAFSGAVSATSFTGDGKDLTNVKAVTSADADNLGGLPAVRYARQDAKNQFLQDQAITGSLTVSAAMQADQVEAQNLRIGSSGAVVKKHLSVSQVLEFGTIEGPGCQDRDIPVPGAVAGDVVALGVISSLANAHPSLSFTGFVKSADTVAVRACVFSAAPVLVPAGNVRVDVWGH